MELRASELGGCPKRQAAIQMGYKPTTTPERMMKVFSRGEAHEAACLAAMEALGWQVYAKQREHRRDILPGVVLSGHLDGMGKPPDTHASLKASVIECKSPNAYHTFLAEMYEPDPSGLTHRYRWQTSCYMHFEQAELIMCTLDEFYELQWHAIETPFYTWEDIEARCRMIQEIVESGELPKYCAPREYPCPVSYLHEDAIEWTIDSELDALVSERQDLLAKRDTADREVKNMNERIKQVMGDRKKVSTELSTVSFYNRRFRQIDKDAMRRDGIDVEHYEREKITEGILSVRSREKKDTSNTGETDM